eukprot:13086000-Alexandrium_andersonii.AAC.1
MCRAITPQALTQGGVPNGVAYDPMSYIVAGLQQRFAQLGDETRLVAVTQLQAFAPHHHESLNATLARFDT